MANPYRGEVDALIDAKPYTLRLTLGALAELEAALDVPDLIALSERFDAGRPSARDVSAVVRAGLRGAGYVASRQEVDAMSFEGGVLGAYRLAAQLLAAAFASDTVANSAT